MTPDTRPGAGRAIVIGGSAGGIEALMQILPRVRPDVGAALVVVIHMGQDQPSLLPAIFQARCQLPVCEAQDKMPLVGGAVYFAAPGYHLLIDDGPRLALSADAPVNFSRPSIDVLFESAADVFGANAVGVLLSGGNDDGAAGLACIRAHGGDTLVQDPAEAEAAMMPRAAIARGAAAHVLSAAAIADWIQNSAGPAPAREGEA